MAPVSPNWGTLITGGMLLVIIAGQWFNTFSSPLTEKFQSINESLTRRFSTQEKDITELRLLLRDIQIETERRRVEVATKTDVATLLGTTRLEFISEIKRLDALGAGSMKQDEFRSWRTEHDNLTVAMQKRIEVVEGNQTKLRELLIDRK